MIDLLIKSPCVCLHVRKAGRQLSQMYDQCLRPAGIRSTQYGMLRCVAELPEPFISDIGRVLGMDQTTVTRNIEKLEKLGLVRARPHNHDPRKKIVELSPDGQAKLTEALPLWEKAQERIMARISDDDFKNLARMLENLCAASQDA